MFEFFKGFGVTFSTMFKKVVTEEYPEDFPPAAPRYHGRHQLNRHPDGLEKCVGCELCAWACPADAIYVEGASNRDEERFSPRIAAVVRPWEDHAFRLSYGLAFRRPSYFENRLHAEIESYNTATPEIVGVAQTQFGNEDLGSEQVQSIEAGWRGRFLDERLQLSADLFFSMYRDTITFVVFVPERMGLPDIAGSTIQYDNRGAEADAFGGEVEAVLRPAEAWMVWCNLGARKVINIANDQDMPSEPHWRVNLGGRYLPAAGWLADVAMHYVSGYKMPLINPANALAEPVLMQLGDRLQVISRVGYRVGLGADRRMEAGLVVRTPLGSPFREYAGIPRPAALQSDVASDFGGERVVRMLSFYLRGSF